MGEDIYLPPIEVSEITGNPGPSAGRMQIDVIDKEALTGDTYRVTFTQDKSTPKFSSFWNLENKTQGVALLDSVKDYLYNNPQISYQATDGFIVKLESQNPDLGKIQFSTSSQWYNTDTTRTNFFYLVNNIDDASRLTRIPGNLVNSYSTIATALDLRNVEITDGEQGKAYRYIVGVVGAILLREEMHMFMQKVLLLPIL